MSELSDMLAARNKALETLDMDYARKMLPDASSDEARLMAMHKARHSCLAISDALRRQSAAWLYERGYRGLNGIPCPPDANLPA